MPTTKSLIAKFISTTVHFAIFFFLFKILDFIASFLFAICAFVFPFSVLYSISLTVFWSFWIDLSIVCSRVLVPLSSFEIGSTLDFGFTIL